MYNRHHFRMHGTVDWNFVTRIPMTSVLLMLFEIVNTKLSLKFVNKMLII